MMKASQWGTFFGLAICLGVVAACGDDRPADFDDFGSVPGEKDGPGNLPGDFGSLVQRLAPVEAPVATEPSGAISDRTPAFVWAPPAGGCSQYQMFVNNAYGANVVNAKVGHEDACNGDLCSWEPSTDMLAGRYRFYVRGLDEAGAAGPWSAPLEFSLSTAPAEAPVLSSPSGFTTLTPTFEWSPIPGGVHSYYVWVNDSLGRNVFKQLVVEAEAGCSGGSGTCSVASSPLAAGSFKFYVRGQDSGGNPGPWSNGLTFTALTSGAEASANLSPSGATYDVAYYRWTPVVGGAPEYQIWVNDSTGGNPVNQTVTESTAGCVGGQGTCAWIGPKLPLGWYKFYVRSRYNNGVFGPWSQGSLFQVTHSCTPRSCSDLGFDCGLPDNGCGEPVANECGSCVAPATCGGGGVENVCGSVPSTCDLSGWSLVQAASTLNYAIPAGTQIPAKGFLVLGRNAPAQGFQTFWKTTFGSNVVYVNTADKMPQINGAETYTLLDSSGAVVDGPTVAMSVGQSVNRINAVLGAGEEASWTRLSPANSSGSPGVAGIVPRSGGPVISEFSDATGTGAYVYEFVEIFCDR